METVAVRSDTSANISRTEVVDQPDAVESQPVLRLRLKKPKGDKKVGWQEGTVDNEHMGKKKSKCCCIYKKPVAFGESSSEDDEECEHCFGHPEKRKKNRKHGDDYDGFGDGHDHDHDDESATCSIHRKAEDQPEQTSHQYPESTTDEQAEANLDNPSESNLEHQAEPTLEQVEPTPVSQ